MNTSPDTTTPQWLDEPDLDLHKYRERLAARWWLVPLCVVAGAIAGYAIALESHQLYVAQTSIYLGQPYSPSGNIQLEAAQTNPATVAAIVESHEPLAAATRRCGTLPRVSVTVPSGNAQKFGQAPVVDIAAYTRTAAQARCSASILTAAFLGNRTVSSFANGKIHAFQQQIAADRADIAAVRARLRTAASGTDRLIATLELRPLQQDLINATQLVQQAHAVEEPRLLSSGAPQRVTARSRRTSVLVAALIGLIVGLLLALAPRRGPRADTREQASVRSPDTAGPA